MNKHILPIFGIFLIFIGIGIFAIGFHNADYCHNMKFLVEGGLVTEYKLNNESWTFDECYLTGLRYMIISMSIIVGSCLVTGYLIGEQNVKTN